MPTKPTSASAIFGRSWPWEPHHIFRSRPTPHRRRAITNSMVFGVACGISTIDSILRHGAAPSASDYDAGDSFDAFKNYLEAAIVFGRTVTLRLQSEYGHHRLFELGTVTCVQGRHTTGLMGRHLRTYRRTRIVSTSTGQRVLCWFPPRCLRKRHPGQSKLLDHPPIQSPHLTLLTLRWAWANPAL